MAQRVSDLPRVAQPTYLCTVRRTFCATCPALSNMRARLGACSHRMPTLRQHALTSRCMRVCRQLHLSMGGLRHPI